MLLTEETKFDFITQHPMQSHNITIDSNPLCAKDCRRFSNSEL